MLPSTIRRAAVQARTPLIKFLGPRSALNEAHHDPTRHPAAPKDAQYPLKTGVSKTTSASPSKVATSGPNGTSKQFLDFANLPNRYRHPQLTEAEIEAVEAGGATLIY
ncbi:hypothetical protein CPC16_011690 [Podila verticillata]|nr:hypothetical protein BGZ52_009206 [Haplosporangium bisporale]KAF9206589.1 hypothetical protein BGZ59_011604 [Podila verticillata]KAF9377737.1 hypothetical protein CPC16_011690 [Podila verticillata]KFH69935.1 hypothetical protein MVEG_04739 [Podila verticillata NRRL 6337]